MWARDDRDILALSSFYNLCGGLLAAHEDDGADISHLRSADRLGVVQSGKQDTFRLSAGQHVTHQISAATAMDIYIFSGLGGKKFSVYDANNFSEFHFRFEFPVFQNHPVNLPGVPGVCRD